MEAMVAELVVVGTTLGEGADVNPTRLVVDVGNTPIGSLKNNSITWMKKDTNV